MQQSTRPIAIHPAVDDCPHPSDGDPSFQESALFVWNDIASGCGGFWRIGQEPAAGRLNSCFGIFTADGLRFRSNVSGVPMSAGDRSSVHMGWGTALRVNLEHLAITAHFPGCEAQLRFEDFHPRYEWHGLVGAAMPNDHARAHFEVSGRMTGHVRISNRRIAIDGLGYRDRSWGPRKWGSLRATRWWPAVFGPDLSAHLLTVVDENFQGTFGYVIRNGVPHAMSHIEALACLDHDALSPRSATARFMLENGEIGELLHEPQDGLVMHVRGYTAVESMGRVRWGDRVGMSNFEISSNPGGGDRPPVLALGANMTDGLSRRSAPTASVFAAQSVPALATHPEEGAWRSEVMPYGSK